MRDKKSQLVKVGLSPVDFSSGDWTRTSDLRVMSLKVNGFIWLNMN